MVCGMAHDEDQAPIGASQEGPEGRTQVLLLDTDLFFAVKIADTLKHAGYVTRTVRSEADFARVLDEAPPALAMVNTAARGIDFQRAIQRARAAAVPVVAFGSHVDVETQEAARRAGATRVIANSKVASDLPGVVERTLRPTQGERPTPHQFETA
jgi:DNA-binding NtrC family response regulator